MYKLPRNKQGIMGSGVDYMYLDPSLSTWQMSKHVVNTTEGTLGRTLNQLYQRYEVGLYMYNNYILYRCYNNHSSVSSNKLVKIFIINFILSCTSCLTVMKDCHFSLLS